MEVGVFSFWALFLSGKCFFLVLNVRIKDNVFFALISVHGKKNTRSETGPRSSKIEKYRDADNT